MAQEQPDSSINWKDAGKQTLAFTTVGAFAGALLNGCVLQMDTTADIPVDTALNRDTVSLVRAGKTRYAALKTPDGVQVFQTYSAEQMTLIQSPALAGDVADKIARQLSGEADHSSPVRVLEAEIGKISMPFLINENHPPRRSIILAQDQADPALNLRQAESAQFWSEVSASIANGQYAVPDKETLPMGYSFPESFMREVRNPKAAIAGALTLNFCMLGGYLYSRREEEASKKAKRQQNPDSNDPQNQTYQDRLAAQTVRQLTGASSSSSGQTPPKRTSHASQMDTNNRRDDDDITPVVLTAVVAHHIATSNGNSNSGGHNSPPQETHHTTYESHSSGHDHHSPGGND